MLNINTKIERLGLLALFVFFLLLLILALFTIGDIIEHPTFFHINNNSKTWYLNSITNYIILILIELTIFIIGMTLTFLKYKKRINAKVLIFFLFLFIIYLVFKTFLFITPGSY